MYAIIEACGKQYKVAEGDVIFMEKLTANEGEKVTLNANAIEIKLSNR